MRFVLRSCAVLALCCCTLSFGFAQTKSDDNNALLPSSPAAAPDPAPAPAKKAKDPHVKPGSDFPHEELFLGYSYVRYSPGGGLPGLNFNGGSTSFAYNFNHYLGLAGDFGGYHAGKNGATDVDFNLFSYLFGPRLSYRNDTRWTPFAQVLFGGAHGHAAGSHSASANGFAMTGGGGLDVALNQRFAIRVFQMEYFLTTFNPNVGGIPSHQNDLRASTGLVIRWGYHPIAINQPPTATCSVTPAAVTIGSPTLVTLSVNGSDADGDSLTYSYSATGGMVNGNGPNARWDLAGLAPGNYTASAQVSDGHGGTASCTTSAVTVNPRPNRAPTVSLGVDRDTVLVGDCVHFTATGTDPDGDRLRYTWTSNGGQLTPSDATAQLCTTGLAAGSYTTTVRVDDGRGGAADASKPINVQAPPPVVQPQASKINECAFKPASSARVDNVCKRILDDVATRLQGEPKATVVVIGYADPKPRNSAKIAGARGQNTLKYLQSKGIDASRVTVRTGAGQVGAGAANQRVELIWVPEGATY